MSSGCVLRLAIARKRGEIGEVLRYGECSTATKCFLQVFWEDEIIPSKVKRLQIFWGTPSPLIFYYWSGSGYARAETYYSLTRLKAIGVGVAGLVGAEEKNYGTEWRRSGARRDRNLAAPSEAALRD